MLFAGGVSAQWPLHQNGERYRLPAYIKVSMSPCLAYTLTQFPLFFHANEVAREYLRTSAIGTQCHSNISRCPRPPLELVGLLWGTQKGCAPPVGQLGKQRQSNRIAAAQALHFGHLICCLSWKKLNMVIYLFIFLFF